MQLKDFRNKDGSRKFCELAAISGPKTLMEHLLTLDGTEIADYVPGLGGSSEDSWIDFTFRGYSFTVNGQYGDWWFFVKDPTCAEDILREVFDHCAEILPVTDWMQRDDIDEERD